MRQKFKVIAHWLTVCLLACSLLFSVEANATQRKNPEAGKKKAAKRIGIGAAIGGAAGGLIGGRKGALIGAGVGAGGGTAYHVNKKRKAKRRARY
ncbi:MAG TPA: YMGG-like glycine zipper-containing protein [Blastocatellia bacterium]|nr:YMGG-like glycine zipper-containing protein [Blastocatellia bacterium]